MKGDYCAKLFDWLRLLKPLAIELFMLGCCEPVMGFYYWLIIMFIIIYCCIMNCICSYGMLPLCIIFCIIYCCIAIIGFIYAPPAGMPGIAPIPGIPPIPGIAPIAPIAGIPGIPGMPGVVGILVFWFRLLSIGGMTYEPIVVCDMKGY